jgi:hypothetical protein
MCIASVLRQLSITFNSGFRPMKRERKGGDL